MLRRHADGFDPRDLAARRRDARARRRRARAQPSGAAASVARLATTCSPTSSTSPAPPGAAPRCSSASARAAPPRCSRPRRRGRGSPATTRVTPDHVQAMLAAGVAAPHPAAPRGRARGRLGRRRPALDRAAGAGADLTWRVSGRFALLVALGVVPVVAGGHRGRGCRVAGAARLAGARRSSRARSTSRSPASPRRVALTRVAPRPGAARRDRHVRARGAATPDRARCAAVVRDGWQPSAGVAGPNRHAAAHPVRRAAPDVAAAHPVATRRATRGAGHDPLVRAARTLVAGRRRSPRPDASACCRRSTPAAHLPSRLARLRELDGRTPRADPRPGHRVRLACASTCAATTCARSTGGRRRVTSTPRCRQHAAHGAHLASGARPPGRDRRRHRRARPPPASTTSRGSTPRWRPRSCSPRSPPARATASTSSPTTGGSAAACTASTGAELLARMVDAHGARSSPSSSRPTGRRCPARCAGSPAIARSSCCSRRPTRPEAPAACSRCSPSSRHAHRGGRVRRRPELLAARHERNAARRGLRGLGGRAGLLDGERVARRHPPPRSAHRDGGAARAAARPRRPLPRAEGGRPALTRGSAADVPGGASAVVSPRRCGARRPRTRRGRRSRPRATPAARARHVREERRRARARRCRSSPATARRRVTNPSMRPETKRTKTSPIATREERPPVLGERRRRAASAPARPTPRRSGGRRRRPRRRTSARAARAARCRGRRRRPVVGEHHGRRDAEVLRVLQDHPRHPDAEDAERPRTARRSRRCSSTPRRRTTPPGSRSSSRRSPRRRTAAAPRRCRVAASTRGSPPIHQRVERGDDERDDGDREGRPAQPVQRRGQLQGRRTAGTGAARSRARPVNRSRARRGSPTAGRRAPSARRGLASSERSDAAAWYRSMSSSRLAPVEPPALRELVEPLPVVVAGGGEASRSICLDTTHGRRDLRPQPGRPIRRRGARHRRGRRPRRAAGQLPAPGRADARST